MLSFDEIVAGLRAIGVPQERAEATARAELGQAGTIVVEMPDDDALEDKQVDAGKQLCRALGGFLYSSIQKKRAKVTPGQPDTLVFFPRHRRMLWWEAKATWGRQSSAQKLFQELCEGCGGDYVVGPFAALEAWIIGNRIASKEADGSYMPLPFHPLIED